MSAELTLSLVAACLTACCAVPQFLRALTVTAGISLSAWMQSFGLGAIWAGYGAATAAWVLLASEGAFALGSLAVVSQLVGRSRTVLYALGAVGLVGAAFAVLGPGTCLLLASFASLATRFTQISASWRLGTAAGVSVASWVLLALSNFAWTAVGALRSDAFFAVSAGAGGVASVGVIITCLVLRGRPLGSGTSLLRRDV